MAALGERNLEGGLLYCELWKLDLISTHRQARKLISSPSPTTKTRLLFFNRAKFKVVTGFLTGHNTLGSHPHLTLLTSSPLCTRCAAGEEISAHVLCECEDLASLRHGYLGSFLLDPENVTSLRLGAIWNFCKGTGLPWFDIRLWGTKGPSKGLGASAPTGLEPNY